MRELIEVIHGTQLDEQVRKMALEPFMDEILRKLAEDSKVEFRVRKGSRHGFF